MITLKIMYHLLTPIKPMNKQETPQTTLPNTSGVTGSGYQPKPEFPESEKESHKATVTSLEKLLDHELGGFKVEVTLTCNEESVVVLASTYGSRDLQIGSVVQLSSDKEHFIYRFKVGDEVCSQVSTRYKKGLVLVSFDPQ